ncbi:MAG: RecQ family ATP-dependent DNA helicase [Bacteroidia bacterium]
MIDPRADIRQILKKYWGFSEFRPLQEEIILSVLGKKNTVALLPTGGGKSICFQVPGLAMGGTTLVISPLIALMNDQVQNLKKKGISAVAISSAMNYKEIEIALNNAALGHVQFLYVSPERLENEDFRMKLSYLPITLVAVDEAHCISQWGYDFRPSYLRIAEVKNYFKELPLIALTASATEEVIADVIGKLGLDKPELFRQSFARSNLRYVVQLEENKIDRLLKVIQNIGGSGIVYVKNRKKTEQITQQLNKLKISAGFYHAGIKNSIRAERQNDWIANKFQVMVATNAFGMGIDKPDVRFVVNLDLPDSLESYFQEAGRAGRDGKTAYSVLLFTKKDETSLKEYLDYAFPTLDIIRNCYNAVCNFYQVAVGSGQGLSIEFRLDEIARSYKLHPAVLYNSVKFLEKEDLLSLVDAGFEPGKCMVTMNKEELYAFQIKYSKYEPLIKTLLRSYGGIFEQYMSINEKDLAYRVKNTISSVTEQLEFLDKQQVISYIPQNELPRLIFLQHRINSKHIELDPKHYKFLKARAEEKVNNVIAYVNETTICRQSFLLNYFNELSMEACGYCDVCLSRKKTGPDPKIRKKIVTLLEDGALHLNERKEKLIRYNDEKWMAALNELIDNGVVAIDKKKNLHLKR